MAIYSKESLETLRQRVDLVDVLSSHIDLKRTGASFKAVCPFHDEKSPSFVVQKGDTHYHCFGCGAHGDAIQFLMAHLKLKFTDAVENLAERFHVQLEQIESSEEVKGPNKGDLKAALEQAARFYHFCLLHTPEGHAALKYLYQRGLDLEFIQNFMIGLAPKNLGIFRQTMHAKFIKDEIMEAAGLLVPGKDGRLREFFSDRITFPIHDPAGAVIGFSARKYKEETFGGKYVNTSETSLFKKSKVLFGLNYSRKRIAKTRKAIIVEGQVDALCLIQAGLNMTVAGQGTAFGEGHVKELLNLGVNQVFLALDSDNAGIEATYKIGNFFQKEGIETRIVQLPTSADPDSFLRENGPQAFVKLLEESHDYLTFLVNYQKRHLNIESPAGKNELVQLLTKQIRSWNHPLMVYESLRKLAHLTQISEEIIGVGQEHVPNIYIKKSASIGLQVVDPNRIIESDFLRWLLLMGGTTPQFIELARRNIQPEEMQEASCRHIYQTYLSCLDQQKPCDLLSLTISMDNAEAQLLLSELLQKKINREKAESQFVETVQKLLDRNWMNSREQIKMKIQSGQLSDDEALDLIKEFDYLKSNPPKVK